MRGMPCCNSWHSKYSCSLCSQLIVCSKNALLLQQCYCNNVIWTNSSLLLLPYFYHLQAPNEKTFFGDNFVRTSGEYQTWQALNLHSMQAFDKGTEVHVQALPSLAEVMYKQFKHKKESLGQKSKEEVLAKYGNEGKMGCLAWLFVQHTCGTSHW